MPYISRIQRFSPDDGPGVRTTVFFKGCSLNCAWCHNPECIEPGESIAFYAEKCIGCGACNGQKIIPETGCPSGALKKDGFLLSPAEIVAEAARDRRYYRNGGGLTLSGGEPLLDADFAAEICRIAAEQEISVAIDTALHVPWENIEKVLPYRPLILADLKAADAQTHLRLTGADNGLILDNLRRIAESGNPYWLSIPVVPEANTAELPAIAEIVRSLPAMPERIRLLPYHDMGIRKEQIHSLPPRGRFTAPSEEEMHGYEELFAPQA